MKEQEVRRYQMLMRVRDFGVSHADAFPAASFGAEKFAAVSAVVAELDGHAVAQSSSVGKAQMVTSSKASLRAELREQMEAINRTARTMALDSPGMENSFRLPRSKGDAALISAARAFVQDAMPLKAEFVKREMPGDFLEELAATISEFEQATNEKNVSTEKRVTATAAIDDAVERGLRAVRELDVVMRNKFRDDPATLAAWTSASHVERTARRRSNGEASKSDAGQTQGSVAPSKNNVEPSRGGGEQTSPASS